VLLVKILNKNNFMHISILAPCHKSFIYKFLSNYKKDDLPEGYDGAPWIGHIIDGLLNKGHQVTVITTTVSINNNYDTIYFYNNQFQWIVIPSRIHSFRFNGNKIGRIIDFYSFEQKKIVDVLLKIKPNIVHSFWSYEFAGAALKSLMPHLVTVQDNAYQIFRFIRNPYRLFRLLMSEKYLFNVKNSTTPSPYMLDYVSRRCKNVKIIPNPVEISMNEHEISNLIANKIHTINFPKIVMVFNGWDKRKNGVNALKAFNILIKLLPNAELYLYGSGTEINSEASLEAYKLGLKNIHFNGKVPHDKVIESIKNSHIFLHPSLEESFGVVLIEAMSFGIPTIGGSKSGAVPWVVNDNDLLIDVLNPIEISDKLYQVLSNLELYNNKCLSCYSNVKNRFSKESIVDMYEKIYETIIKHD